MSSRYSGRPVALLPAQERRWAMAGFVLVVVLLALLVSVMNENVAQAQSTRDMAAQKAQERGVCNAVRDRRQRDQCFLDLRLIEPAQIAQR